MTDKQFTQEALELLKGAGIKIEAFEQFDGEDGYVGTTYVLVRSSDDAWANIEDVHELQLSQKVYEVSDDADKHLTCYLENRAKRTGQKWTVIERYHTAGPSRYSDGYDRALLRAEDGSTLRVYYRKHQQCWAMGQKVLAPKDHI